MKKMAPIIPKYRKLLTGLEKSGKSPESDAVAILSILYLIIPFVIAKLFSSSFSPSDSATKYSSTPVQSISSSSYSSFNGDIYAGSKNFV